MLWADGWRGKLLNPTRQTASTHRAGSSWRALQAWPTWLFVITLCWLVLPAGANAAQAPMAQELCTPLVVAVAAARTVADGDNAVAASMKTEAGSADPTPVDKRFQDRPAHGWTPAKLPHTWSKIWPEQEGPVWYRITWERGCATGSGAAPPPVALAIDGISMAGALFSNDDLLWRDASLVEPLSRSWNKPRWWVLPESSLHAGLNTIWVRVTGVLQLSPGLGALRLGSPQQIEEETGSLVWRQRTAHILTAGWSAAMGCLFLVVWAMRRAERAYGWYALMSLCWGLYLATLMATDPWPFADTLAMSRANIVVFVGYVVCFCQFTWRFGEQSLPRLERALWVLAVLGIAVVLWVPQTAVAPVLASVFGGFALIVLANCLQFQWHAWRTREPQHILLALCWLTLLVVGVHELVLVLAQWQAHNSWAPITGLVGTVFMAMLLGGRMAVGMRRIEHFNHELAAGISVARGELALALAREHTQALQHAKLQERVDISHDLHDGLGGSLVRSMALVELAPAPLTNERVLSLLKTLRDDLRQVIDYGSSAVALVPATPVQWAAPLRHRFTRILDELGVVSQWRIAPQWQGMPTALQCLGLVRLVEEALSNVIKHSQAQRVRVSLDYAQPKRLMVQIDDDGAGFDVAAVQAAGLSVGMRSMTARAARMGGTCEVSSGPQGTVVCVILVL